MKVSPRVFLLAIPLFAALGALSLWSRRTPSRLQSTRSVVRAPEAAPLSDALANRTTAPAQAGAAPLGDATASIAPRPATSAVSPVSEDALASEMHELEDSNPARALEIARRGQSLWPNGARAAEFAAVEVKCLYRLGNPSAGRGAAEAMVNKYVGSPWALEVERQTGAHAYVNH